MVTSKQKVNHQTKKERKRLLSFVASVLVLHRLSLGDKAFLQQLLAVFFREFLVPLAADSEPIYMGAHHRLVRHRLCELENLHDGRLDELALVYWVVIEYHHPLLVLGEILCLVFFVFFK